MKNLIKVFFNKGYFAFCISQFLGVFNDHFFRIALATYIMLGPTSLSTGAKYFFASFLIAVFMVPSLLFSATAGEIADRYRKDIVIRIVKLAQLLLAFIGIAGFLVHSVTVLLIVLFISGILSAFFSPVKYSAVPELLEHEQLVAGNSIVQAGTYISMLLGNICGILVYSIDKSWLFLIYLTVAVIGLTAALFIPELKTNTQKFDISKNFIKTTFKNMSYLKYTKDIYMCILGISWFWFVGVVLVYQIPNFAEIVLKGQQDLYIFLALLLTSGVFVGALLSCLLLKKEISIKYVPISVVLMTVFIVDLSFSANYAHVALTTNIALSDFLSTLSGIRIIIDVFAYSLFAGLYIVPLITMLQVLANRKIRARVFATNAVVNVLFMIAGCSVCFIFIKMGLAFPAVLTLIALFNVVAAIYICTILPAHLLRIIVKRIIDILYKIEVVGIENFEKCKGGTLIIANHTSLIDGIILSVTFGEKLSFAINSDVINKFWMKPLLKIIKYFPVDNTNVMVVKSIIDEIKKGGMVVIFPEGRITTTGGLMKVYPGPAVIADKSDADILPICIEGIQYSDFSYFGAKSKIKRQRKIKLTILPPRKLNVNQSLSDSRRRNIAITKLYDIMCEMKFASNFSDKTLFESLIDSLSLVGRRKKILEDINRQPINLGDFLGAVFAFTHKISKQTENKEYVGIIAANTKTMIEIFFALSALNRIPAMINFTDSIENILYNLKNVGITKVYTSKRFIKASNLNNLTEALKENGIKVIYAEDIKDSFTMFNKMSAYLKSHFPRIYYKNICSTFDVFAPAVILFTSAFKGKSKAVVLSHKNIQASRAQLSSVMDFGILDSFFNAMPIFSSLGLVAGTLLPLLRGIKVFEYHSPLHYKMVSELVYDTDSTVLLGTDTFLSGYAKNAHPYDFYAIRYVIAGIEKLKEETIQIWEDNFGKRIFEAYGTTETASTISINTPMYFKEYSVGRLLPSVECKLESTTAFVGSSHLLVKGPNIANCYIENKQLISKKENGEWFDTGDIVEIDRDGFVFMKGKSKRFTKVDGESISLTELEFNISNIWKEHKSAVLAVQNNRKKEIVVFTTKQDADLGDLQKFAQEQKIENFVLPDKIVVVEKIPIIGTGATDYTKLHEIFKELNK
jgi:acyl-[acyl-carrier-protein]-phospholipid O-acyltransferase/long-chain-fatty-acid--[acyl-carrier-protein] ligase